MSEKQIVNINSGKLFPRAFQNLAYVGILFAIYSFTENVYTGLIVLIVSSFIAFITVGKQLDLINRKYYTYLLFPFFKLSKARSYKDFPFITIIKRRLSKTTFGGKTMNSITLTDNYFDICLLSENHLKKIALERFKDKVKALNKISFLANKLAVEITEFKPSISKVSKYSRLKSSNNAKYSK